MTHDHTWTPFQLGAKYAAWLKPGVEFSAIDADVIAIWPSYQAEMAALPGLTVEQARQRLREYGHIGPVIVEELNDFHPGCPLGTVCSTSHQGGTFIDVEIVLRVNRATLAIPAPPP